FVRKARPKIPSKRASILCSSERRTMTGDTRRSMLTNGYNETGGPHGHHERGRRHAGDDQQRRNEEPGTESGHGPEPARPRIGQGRRDRGEHDRLDREGRPGEQRPPERSDDGEGVIARGDPNPWRTAPVERERGAADAGHDS